jgi:polygalacturonase
MAHMKLTSALAVALLVLPIAATAQDTRKVVEPSIPPACTILKAKIGRAGTSIVPEDETKLDTARIQSAIDACPAGQAVVLQRAADRTDAFLSGPLRLRKGVVLTVDRGAFLYASRNPRDYDTAPGLCGTITTGGKRGCLAFITGEDTPDSGIMGDGVIDGRGGEAIIGQNVTWWNLADKARAGGSQQVPRLIQLIHCDNFTLYRITLMNSANFHVSYNRGNGFTVWGVKIWTPQRARNTDGIDPGNSTNVTIAHSYISTGDDHVAIKAGAGPPTSHMSIVHNHFYAGHGVSIGSETDGGASDILVSDLSIDGADNGLHIKSNSSRGGLVKDVTYEDVCIRDTARPVLMETGYSDPNTKPAPGAEKIPVYRDIAIRNVRVQGGGRVTLEGMDEAHRLGIQFDNLVFDDPDRIRISAAHADVKAGPGPLNLTISGPDVAVTGDTAPGVKNACTGKFVEFPLR